MRLKKIHFEYKPVCLVRLRWWIDTLKNEYPMRVEVINTVALMLGEACIELPNNS
jgi:hypothetical protein